MEILYCKPQATYVVIEQIHLKTGLPSIADTIGPTLYQVFRRVLQTCDVHESYFNGKRFIGAPTTWQVIQELFLPGPQISTVPIGERRLNLVYAGFRNILQPLPRVASLLPEAWTRRYDLGAAPVPYTYGTDPIASVQLYGNPRADFVMPAGEPPPTALAIYEHNARKLVIPDVGRRDIMLRELVMRDTSNPLAR